MKETKISIVIAHLNDLCNLKLTIDSIITSKSRCYEIIVIDGLSKGVDEVLGSYLDCNLKYISEKDSGIYDAMNKGVAIASGEFVLFLNAGDTLTNESSLDELIIFTELSNTAPLTDIFVWKVSVDNDPKRVKFGVLKQAAVGSEFSHQGCLIRRQLLDTYPYDTSYELASDYKFFKTCLSNDVIFQYSNKVLTNVTSGGLSDVKRLQVVSEWSRINKEFGMNFVQIINFFRLKLMIILSVIKNRVL